MKTKVKKMHATAKKKNTAKENQSDEKSTNEEEESIESNNEGELEDNLDQQYIPEEEDKFPNTSSKQKTNLDNHQTTKVRVTNKQNEICHIYTQIYSTEEYTKETANVIEILTYHMNEVMDLMHDLDTYVLAQTHSLKQSLKRYQKEERKYVNKEVEELHNRIIFVSIYRHETTTIERKGSMESLLFRTEKRDKAIKARTCTNDSTQQSYIYRKEATSLTAATEAALITGMIEAKKKMRHHDTLDMTDAFI